MEIFAIVSKNLRFHLHRTTLYSMLGLSHKDRHPLNLKHAPCHGQQLAHYGHHQGSCQGLYLVSPQDHPPRSPPETTPKITPKITPRVPPQRPPPKRPPQGHPPTIPQRPPLEDPILRLSKGTVEHPARGKAPAWQRASPPSGPQGSARASARGPRSRWLGDRQQVQPMHRLGGQRL